MQLLSWRTGTTSCWTCTDQEIWLVNNSLSQSVFLNSPLFCHVPVSFNVWPVVLFVSHDLLALRRQHINSFAGLYFYFRMLLLQFGRMWLSLRAAQSTHAALYVHINMLTVQSESFPVMLCEISFVMGIDSIKSFSFSFRCLPLKYSYIINNTFKWICCFPVWLEKGFIKGH